jgi:hypothetical protein
MLGLMELMVVEAAVRLRLMQREAGKAVAMMREAFQEGDE